MLRLIRDRYSALQRLRSFKRREDGATAVEFALVALPFFGLVFAILELAIFFFASRYLEDAVFNMSRKILTQRIDASNACSAVQTEINNLFGTWLSPSKLTINFSSASNFTAAAANVSLGGGSCSGLVTPGQVVIVTATYQYPFQGFRFVSGGAAMGKDYNLSARTAFRIEP